MPVALPGGGGVLESRGPVLPEGEEASSRLTGPRALAFDDADMALIEIAHERDVSIGSGIRGRGRERLVRDRLASLGPLEQRVEIAERRVRDAERRLGRSTSGSPALHSMRPPLRTWKWDAGAVEPGRGREPLSEPTDDAARPPICEDGSRPHGAEAGGEGRRAQTASGSTA